MILDEVLFKALEAGQKFTHYVYLSVCFTPFQVAKPSCWIRQDLYLARRSGKEESKLVWIHLLVTKHHVDCKFEREQKLVFLKKRSTNVLVKRESEMVI